MTTFLSHPVSNKSETYFDLDAFEKYLSDMEKVSWQLESFAYDIHNEIVNKIESCKLGDGLDGIAKWHNDIATNIRMTFRVELERLSKDC